MGTIEPMGEAGVILQYTNVASSGALMPPVSSCYRK